jgi:hypothetical protein
MTKQNSWILSKEEAEEILQNILDNNSIYLIRQNGGFYNAESYSQELDGAEIDERMAQYFNIDKCEHYAVFRDYEECMLVIDASTFQKGK